MLWTNLSFALESSASSGFRKELGIILASVSQSVTSRADSGYREPPSSTVWNCHVHDRSV